LASGARTVRIHGRDVAINAEVAQLQSSSAHADAGQLLAWLRAMPAPPSQVYVVHGDPGAADELRCAHRP
jgi:metallo-beta-lactamase family protein